VNSQSDDVRSFIKRGRKAQQAVDEVIDQVSQPGNMVMARTEDQYFAQVNQLLKTASPIGAYCLAFAEVLRRECGLFPPLEIMEAFVNCRTVAEGIEKLATIREFQRGLPRPMRKDT